MSNLTTIEWTDATWNPVTGCTKISAGCANCYAERMAHRLQAMRNPSYHNGFNLTVQPRMLERPLHWAKPRHVFVNSMSDLFHDAVPTDYIKKVFSIMEQTSQHQFQVLTKRSRRLAELSAELSWPANVWMGVSVEDERVRFRIDDLRRVPAAVRFISAEPLIGPLPSLNLEGINWVIVGGESGPGARPMDPTWVRDIRDQCVASNAAFFFKQWGGVQKSKTGRILDGRIWNEMPANTETLDHVGT